jgi:hypothetical protein
MEIHSLRVSLSEQDLNSFLSGMPSGKNVVEKLRVRMTPEGIVVMGEYPTMLMRMAFETLWEVKGVGSVVEARLAAIKVSGLPASMLRGVLLKTLRDTLAKEPGIRVEDDVVRVDLSKLREAQKLNLRLNLTQVRCDTGTLLIEAGPILA